MKNTRKFLKSKRLLGRAYWAEINRWALASIEADRAAGIVHGLHYWQAPLGVYQGLERKAVVELETYPEGK